MFQQQFLVQAFRLMYMYIGTMNAHMFKEGDKSFLKFPAISREQSTGDRINAKRSVKCVHPVTFLARKIVDEASSQLRGNKVAREKGTGLRYRLIYNLQFLFFRCLHFTRRSSSPFPSLSLSLSPLFSQFCLLQRHCFPSVLNYEGKLRDRKSRNSSLFQGTNDTNAFSLVQTDTRSYFQLRRRFVCARRGGEGRRELFQMSK